MIEDIDFDFSIPDPEKLKEEEQWNTLINHIIDGKVIPVIGPNILVEGGNLHKWLIKLFARKFQLDTLPSTFSQLIYDEKFLMALKNNKEQIYPLIASIFAQKQFEPSSLLTRILSIRQFPFVITTSFAPIVEEAMDKVWKGRKVKTLIFSDNPRTTQKPGVGDLEREEDIYTPTVYYMFGKVCNEAGRFVVTDADMLRFCKSWLSESCRPKIFSSALSGKYLLVLGNDYSDWLFRFIWFSMKTSLDAKPGGMVVSDSTEKSLETFLRHLDTFTQKDPVLVIDEIERRLSLKLKQLEPHKFDIPQRNTDVFISYSRTNSDIANCLYNELTSLGLNVWYDKVKLKTGSIFMQEINEAINTTKIFIPIISSAIPKEAKEFHVYRREWEYAIEQASGYGREFIYPLCEDGYDFYNSTIPKPLRDRNAYLYKNNMDIKTFANKILSTINEL